MLHSGRVVDALKKVENRILKLDSAIEATALLMNQPLGTYKVEKIVEQFKQFEGQFILQTMFLKGSYDNTEFDNTSDAELKAYLELVDQIRPEKVMIYTIARDTPADTLEKISKEQLDFIADKIRGLGITVEVSA